MCEACYDKTQPNLGEKKLQLHYTDIDKFALNIITNNIIEDL